MFPDWDAVADRDRPFLVYCDASIIGLGGTLEQEEPDGSIRPVAPLWIQNATTTPDLEAGSIIWSIKRLRGYLWCTKFRIFSDHKALENIDKVGEHNARVQRWLESLTVYTYTYTLEYRKYIANGNADSLFRLPQPATEINRTGP